MLGELNDQQIENLLNTQITGRIACSNDGVPYIVPINYYYDGEKIIAHSVAGKKISIMRKNPVVCFQVDEIKSIFNWQSVIAWGRFEEISDMEEKGNCMEALKTRIQPFSEPRPDHTSHGLATRAEDLGLLLQLIFYKIILVMKSGRFENS
ncbi:pyridoxamine 5'-phosphate oxidase family protein [Pedobacter sp. ISL-68]|uniref:pyridoxamine 5'-phosphate oxidase family protein n=1 Tax=unclassified Pedobacter TaxID=2628915 RepID=UPI001BE63C02|nr:MULTISPECIES: pyridoxamine 5'-phosphate oxidase family protein [unclassified Pedobacter]MBT2560664.1 pyridoxamine 5'-phosphate oxidase family protein [Pedobacter sp. ISL-64]MBT2590043.1 pyridoxamine 5'-phosphate oxidase family protein [Pedobacter sp. ISL-68]